MVGVVGAEEEALGVAAVEVAVVAVEITGTATERQLNRTSR